MSTPTVSGHGPAAAPVAPGQHLGRSAEPAPTGVQALDASVPVRLQVPAIDVESAVQELGLDDGGAMEVPAAGFPAGGTGPAVLAGHVDWDGEPGVFAGLHRLQPGDDVRVLREDGTAAVFRVSRVERVAKDAFPTAAVYGDLDDAGLRLVTCGGPFDRRVGHHRDNVVVYAELRAARAT